MIRIKEKTKMCQSCGQENTPRAKECSGCKYKKFAPRFVRKLEKVNMRFYVQVTEPYEIGKNKRITLYKWWPGDNSSFHINTIEQWERIKEIIDTKLAKFLDWKSKKDLLKEIEIYEKEDKDSSGKIKNLTKNYPDFLRRLLKDIDFSQVKEGDYKDLADILNDLIEIVNKTDESFRFAFRKVINQLPKEHKRAIEDLSELLRTWSLKQLNSISHHVIDRLENLKLFKERVLDDNTYEIIGNNSIHRILEKSMWIIDERYWLMHSNETLRKIVEKELPKKDRRYKDKRPDFVCGTIDGKLIIIELKRPSHVLAVEDLNQIETYLSIIEQHHKFSTFEAYLVGRKISDELSRRKKYRGNQFKVITFTELIEDTERRYKDYLEAIGR